MANQHMQPSWPAFLVRQEAVSTALQAGSQAAHTQQPSWPVFLVQQDRRLNHVSNIQGSMTWYVIPLLQHMRFGAWLGNRQGRCMQALTLRTYN